MCEILQLSVNHFQPQFPSSLISQQYNSRFAPFTLPSIFNKLCSVELLDRNVNEALAAAAVGAFREPHSDSGAEEEREEVGDEERVDGLLRVGRTLPVVVETRLDCVEGPAGVVGAQLARRRRFSTSDNVGKLPLLWRNVGP